MPLLKRNEDLFPLSFFDLAPGDFPWWVAHVHSRQEKALARQLFPLGIPFYLPLRRCRTRRRGRTFTSYLPLFPSYVFFRGSATARHTALRTNLIVKVLDVAEPDRLLEELSQIRRLQEAGADLVPLVDLRPGDPVRVVDGPFQGYTGVLLQARGRSRLIVSISMLKLAAAVEFPPTAVASVPQRDSRPRGTRGVATS